MTKPKAPGTTRSELKRQAILDAAAELFLQRGYPGTSMDDVAIAAGVSKQTVYAQFASKEALFVSLVHGMTTAAGDVVMSGMEELPSRTTLAAHLTAYAIRQLEVVRTPRLMQLRRLVIAEAERFPELGKALLEGGPSRAIDGLSVVFARWTKQGLLRAPNAKVAASTFNWLVMADPVNRVMLLGDAAAPAPAELRRHAKEAVRVFLAAYGKSVSRRT